jgi:hypothetical protein
VIWFGKIPLEDILDSNMVNNSNYFVLWSNKSVNPTIKSKVKFKGDYKKALRELLEIVEVAIEEKVGEVYTIDSILGGGSNLKVRISDDAKGIECIINCVFEYNHTDMAYGNVHIELVVVEVSKKPRSVLLDKYSVLEHERASSEVVEGIIGVMRRL